jgi:DNA replicative helicase MCM subunit Mcm2 (Cdc46/Mcm family)
LNFKEFQFSEEVENKVNSIRNSLNDQDLFKKMSESICPEIFGMEEVK